ncbi:MAG: hypothetical protein COA91_09545 [Robiginitomaculum sp.]|nr:MAG: hypothetical protein COA91_09545 [Robiginitomaculum sp.]
MGNLFLSPYGRIGSAAFYRCGYILILISIALSLINLLSPQIGKMLGIISYALIYPWVVIWIKRLHNGGKSGWMFLVYLIIYFVVAMVGFGMALSMFGGDVFMQMLTDQVEGRITQAEMQTQLEIWARENMAPMLIASIGVSVLTMFIGDKTIPTDADDNQYGPVP